MTKIVEGQRIGILTAGGDCPGLNAAIRGVGKTAIVKYNMKVIGISDGYTGLINKEYRELAESDLSGILTLGGTILGTSREKPFKRSGKGRNEIKNIMNNLDSTVLSVLVATGLSRPHIFSQWRD
jgi:6-phosphofructokinase